MRVNRSFLAKRIYSGWRVYRRTIKRAEFRQKVRADRATQRAVTALKVRWECPKYQPLDKDSQSQVAIRRFWHGTSWRSIRNQVEKFGAIRPQKQRLTGIEHSFYVALPKSIYPFHHSAYPYSVSRAGNEGTPTRTLEEANRDIQADNFPVICEVGANPRGVDQIVWNDYKGPRVTTPSLGSPDASKELPVYRVYEVTQEALTAAYEANLVNVGAIGIGQMAAIKAGCRHLFNS